MFDDLSIRQFEDWLLTKDIPSNQKKAVASFVQSTDFVNLSPTQKEITCHYLANLVLK